MQLQIHFLKGKGSALHLPFLPLNLLKHVCNDRNKSSHPRLQDRSHMFSMAEHQGRRSWVTDTVKETYTLTITDERNKLFYLSLYFFRVFVDNLMFILTETLGKLNLLRVLLFINRQHICWYKIKKEIYHGEKHCYNVFAFSNTCSNSIDPETQSVNNNY